MALTNPVTFSAASCHLRNTSFVLVVRSIAIANTAFASFSVESLTAYTNAALVVTVPTAKRGGQIRSHGLFAVAVALRRKIDCNLISQAMGKYFDGLGGGPRTIGEFHRDVPRNLKTMC